MGVGAMRHVNDGLELVWFMNLSRGFEVFTVGMKVESLARLVGSHCVNFYGGVAGHGTRLLVLVMKKESEARRRTGFDDCDFNKAVTEVHEEAAVRSAFGVPTVMRVFAEKVKMAVASAANVLNYMEKAESLNHMVEANGQSPARDPGQPAANLSDQRDAAPCGHAVCTDQ